MKDNNIYVYSLYRNSDDELLILDGKGAECAERMGVSYQWFYKLMMLGGINRKWTITRRKKGEEDDEDE